MRHRKGNRKLARPTDQRLAMLRELATGTIYASRIETTLMRAKVARPYLEKLVSKAVQGRRLDEAAEKTTSVDEARDLRAQAIHLRRQVRAKLGDPTVVKHLFEEVARHYMERPGGYTRIIRTGFRRGDGAETAILEFVG